MVADLNTHANRKSDLESWRLPESEFVMYDEDEDEEGEFGGDEPFEEEGDDFLEDDEDFLEDDEELEEGEEMDDDDDDDL